MAKDTAEKVVKDIRRATRKQYSAEEKIRIVLEGLRGEDSIAELCRREGIAQNLYYRWSKDFLEAGKKRLAGDTARAATSDEVKDLRREATALKEVVADLTLENRLLKKSVTADGEGRGMRYSASEKLEIIRLVEQSHLPVRRTLGQIGIPRSTFYRWYDQYQTGGPEALDDRSPRPDRVWNRIPDDVRSRVVTLALDEPELSPRELAVRFTDGERYFVSEASVYRLLETHDLITSPAFIVDEGRGRVHTKTTAPDQLWQTDFTYLKVTGWGWFYSARCSTTSRATSSPGNSAPRCSEDITDTWKLALRARVGSGYGCCIDLVCCRTTGQATYRRRPRQLARAKDMRHPRGAPCHPQTQGKIERWHQTLKNRILLENYYLPGDLEAQVAAFVAYYNHRRSHESLDNLTPADVYFGAVKPSCRQAPGSNSKTIQNRRLLHHSQAA